MKTYTFQHKSNNKLVKINAESRAAAWEMLYAHDRAGYENESYKLVKEED